MLAGGSIDPFTGVGNPLSISPGKYGGNVKTQRNRRGSTQAVDHVAQFDDKRRTLPGLDILMKIRGNPDSRKALAQVLHG